MTELYPNHVRETTIVTTDGFPEFDPCGMCDHPEHDSDETCEQIIGYSHLAGDEFCGCPGPPLGQRGNLQEAPLSSLSNTRTIPETDTIPDPDQGK